MGASLLSILLAGWAGSLLVEQHLRPRPALLRRPLAAHLVHGGLYLAVFCLLLAILQRPLFSALLDIALLLIMVLVNNAKYRALREPFVFTDFTLYSQALRHPRLYLPYLGLPAMIAIPVVTLAVFTIGLLFEPPLTDGIGLWPLLLWVCGGLLMAAGMLWAGDRWLPPPAETIVEDVSRLGLLASLWLHHRCSRHWPVPDAADLQAYPPPPADHGAQAHVVAVQSESFFDARRLHPAIRDDILAHYDDIADQALLRGRLQVPAWGANTMRTEFAFLSGIDSRELGPHRFNPYQTLLHQPVITLASQLRARGYRTICIHPYPADFFQRNRVYPLMGFDQFIDIADFGDAERAGPYISDAAVTAKIGEILRTATQPTFVFAITMENHGPLHLESVNSEEEQRYYRTVIDEGLDDLTVYLRHLRNADRMLASLQSLLLELPRPGLLCFYGDHVPGMPAVFERLDYYEDDTDYLIWSTARRGSGAHRDAAAHHLAGFILQALKDHADPSAATGGHHGD